MSRLSHIDHQGAAQMVDVSRKESSVREAVASAESICCQRPSINYTPVTYPKCALGRSYRSDSSRKKTADLIPLCHPLLIDDVKVDFLREEGGSVECDGSMRRKTGVEMEALTAVSVGLLALYDMVKAVERTARIDGICLLKKVVVPRAPGQALRAKAYTVDQHR